MFLLKDTLDSSTTEFYDIKDMMDLINSEWPNCSSNLDRICTIVGNMKWGERYEFGRFSILCVDESLVVKRLWLGSNAAPGGFYHADTVNKAKNAVLFMKSIGCPMEIIAVGDELNDANKADGGSTSAFINWCDENSVNVKVVRLYTVSPKYKDFDELHKAYGIGCKKSRKNDRCDLTEDEERRFVSDCFDTYEYLGFSETFHSPHEEYEEDNGKRFVVLGRLKERTPETAADQDSADLSCLPMWVIQFEDGTIAQAYPEEICSCER